MCSLKLLYNTVICWIIICDCYTQTQLVELSIPLKLEWKKGKTMPFGMSAGIQAVVIGGKIYVGGGYCILSSQRATVMVYSLHTGLWSTLPPYETQYFSMAAVNNQLVLVGGRNLSTNEIINVLGVWDEESQTWTCPFPMMPTSRGSLSVASYQNWLIVAGGRDERNSRSNKVELLDTLSGQWYEGSPLPNAYSSMSSVISGNMWYLSRGRTSNGAPNKRVLSVCLDELVFQAISGTTSISSSSPWQTLTNTPLTNSTVLVFNGALLAFGGDESSAIHLYQPSTKSWVNVGGLPTERWECACTVLPSGEVFLVGGGANPYCGYSCVDIATIQKV